jgi:hypothetical protein
MGPRVQITGMRVEVIFLLQAFRAIGGGDYCRMVSRGQIYVGSKRYAQYSSDTSVAYLVNCH